MRIRADFENWTLVAAAIAGCLLTGRLAAGDSFAGTKAGQERAQRPWCGTFCWCPPGKFRMGEKNDPRGNARPVDVTIRRGFWMGKYEVTQAQYRFVTGKNPSKFKGMFRPVERVSWTDAAAFCTNLTALERKAGRLPAGWEYRLPTEAQWEYACRAGTTTRYSFGDDAGRLSDYAWYLDNSGTKEGQQRLNKLEREERLELSPDEWAKLRGMKTHPVGEKKPNEWGLCDMHGNVGEWCRDWYRHKVPGGSDPEVMKKATGRTVRGGNWFTAAPTVRVAFRLWGGVRPGARSSSLGFRVAIVRARKPAAKP